MSKKKLGAQLFNNQVLRNCLSWQLDRLFTLQMDNKQLFQDPC